MSGFRDAANVVVFEDFKRLFDFAGVGVGLAVVDVDDRVVLVGVNRTDLTGFFADFESFCFDAFDDVVEANLVDRVVAVDAKDFNDLQGRTKTFFSKSKIH